ncbi:MAG: 50S ribosomal protein L3 [Flavobacteriaceae bacterium]|jgi:large subunit ribosomal protein L3|nr:50S ribosomal protein L3 [Flavobacteriaceae bacterium]
MQAGLFAKKVGMTQIFDESGTILPVTILKTGLCQVSQIKTVTTDGYNAIQVAYGEEKLENINKSTRGHLKKVGDQGFRSFGEFRVTTPEDFKLGQIINLNTFSVGQKVRVTGKSIGKGFAGNQKRHNFSRGPMTHGSKNHRLPGSIGAGSTPGRVYPGKKMAGQLGGGTVTLKNTEILYINSEDNILVLKGSVPGKKSAVLKIQPKKY